MGSEASDVSLFWRLPFFGGVHYPDAYADGGAGVGVGQSFGRGSFLGAENTTWAGDMLAELL